ncbi:Zinc finger, C3HC4 RING-type [Penicillium camemberti]|uniref:Zinc finger, C3HC4 RING-type n=1 Tax=Penicillium camemberti (strain FM 013) TaxID=1429867 RepID=A0A0G4NWX8_PENC3|nr:Zinc finger, C3HC4 RING-type [Penicillium camemberti]
MGLFLFFLLFFSVQAKVVSLPSNTTIQIQSTGFRIEGSTLTGQKLVPLVDSLIQSTTAQLKVLYALRNWRGSTADIYQSFNVSGTATQVIPSNSLNLKSSQIACVSCDQDDYTGNIRVDETIEYVTSAQSAAAILLYSKTATGCNFTSDDQTAARYPNIFTFTTRGGYSALLGAFNQSTTISIVSMSYLSGVPSDNDAGGTSDSPNTAMIILYSITGIITALFLGIIITGAVRAHRHPERYGPRRIAGRVRQSRARGIARAMLDTIPVVKFDDKNDDVEAAKRNVEMVGAEDREHSQADGNTGVSTPRESEMPTPDDNERPTPTAPEAKTEMPEAGNFSCPICTDDFIKGQDLRVLPCNHQFHMECIDPWLMNVSGTCPLCRIDLNPPQPENPEQPEENTEQPDHASTEGGPVLTTEQARQQAREQARHTHRRLTNYLHGPLNARRMRDATVEERLAALRRVREANQGEAAPEEGSRRGLTTRLRDRFRIRTRAHGAEAESSADAENAAPSPAAPAPVHLTPSTA